MKSLLYLLLCLLFTPLLLQAEQLDKVSLQLQWKHQFEYAGFYAAVEKGYYAAEGLEVELREIQPGTDPVQEVLEGRADFGITYSSLIADYLNGKPVVMMANIFKQSALVLVSQNEIGLPSDLIGKRVMGSTTELSNSGITMMFHRFDMGIDDIKVVEPTQSIDDFANRRVDAMTAFITNQPYLLNLKHIKYTIHNPTSYGSQFYDVNLFTSQAELKSNPVRVEAFRRASIKGWQYALEHSDEIIELILKKYNSQNKSDDALSYEAEITKSLILPNVYQIGSIDCRILKEMAENFIKLGMASKNSDLDFKGFLLNHSCTLHRFSDFSPAEQAYLLKKEAIRVCADPNWMPFERVLEGKHIGMAADYMRAIESMIDIPITLVPTKSWSESIAFAKARKCDIFSLAMETPERKEYMDFTKPYLVIPLVIATTTDKFFISDLEEVLDEKLGMVKGYAFTELLKLQYPSINIVEVDSVEQGLAGVADGELFGFIDNLTTIGYQMQKSYIGTLKIAGRIGQNWELGIAVRNDEPILLTILDKAIGNIDEKTRQGILNQWMSIDYEKGFDYALFWKVLGAMGIVLLFILYRNIIVRRYNKNLLSVNRELEELSVTDSLTKLHNRRSLDKNIHNAFDLAARYKTPFALILLDIDDFKKINDTYGHDTGDKVLQKIAEILSSQSRKSDITGRWGGEEFLIICPSTHLDGAQKMSEKLRLAIEKESFGIVTSVTASFGVTEYEEHTTIDAMITLVDKALYRAKAEGKNRVAANG